MLVSQYSNVLSSPCPQATPRFYLAAVEKNGCEIKSWSSLGTKLALSKNEVICKGLEGNCQFRT